MTNIVIIQARMNSSRLPAKVLLPIAGIPLVVLAARRAANTGRNVIVATSAESSDDGLVDILKRNGIACYRGSLENTLSRFTAALEGLDDDTIVFRLTGDNVLPDGQLLDQIEQDFLALDVPYLRCNGLLSGLPYGLSAEVTRLACLREACRHASDPWDREHVTPYIVRKYGDRVFDRYADLKLGNYRCTVDSLDDYFLIEQLFRDVPDPVEASSIDLAVRLGELDPRPVVERPATSFVLGAAQLGMPYGISNKSGQPSLENSREIITTALANGVEYIDTARSYGDSENVIRQSLIGSAGGARIVTKLAPMENCPEDAAPSTVDAFVDASIYASMATLGLQNIDTLLLHRAAYIHEWGGQVWKRLVHHRNEARIQNLGVSVQSPEELVDALQLDDVSHIQLPFNILDSRFDNIIPRIEHAKSTRRLVIHARSTMLQGLLCSRDPEKWRRAHVSDPSLWKWLDHMRAECETGSAEALCIRYVLANPWVDGIVIGVETQDQLLRNLTIMMDAPLSADQIHTIQNSRPDVRPETLNPALWRTV